MNYRTLDYVMWIVAPLVQTGVLVAMFRRGLHRRYPCFFGYTVVEVASVPILAAFMYFSYEAYYYSYYVNLILTVLLSGAVLWEVATVVFAREGMPGHVRLFVKLCVVVVLIAVLGFAIDGGGVPRYGSFTSVIMISDRLVRILQVLLAVILVAYGVRLAISARQFVFGLMGGFGFFAVVNLVIARLVRDAALGSVALSRINGSAYILACIVWVLYALFGTDAGSREKTLLQTRPDTRYREFRDKTSHWFMRWAVAGPKHN